MELAIRGSSLDVWPLGCFCLGILWNLQSAAHVWPLGCFCLDKTAKALIQRPLDMALIKRPLDTALIKRPLDMALIRRLLDRLLLKMAWPPPLMARSAIRSRECRARGN